MCSKTTFRTFLIILLSLGLNWLGLTEFHSGSAFAQSGKLVYTFPLGLQTYTYRNQLPKDVVGTLDLIKSLGFTEIEGGVPKGMTVEEYKNLLTERGITVTSTGSGYDQIVKDPEIAVKQAKALGASFVMVAWIPHQKGSFSLENARKAVEDFNRVGKVLKDSGLTFCYHTHGFEFQPYQDGTLFDYMVKNTNPDYVSFEMDILWVTHGGADPVALLKKYGNRWKLMHLKDLKKGIKGDFTGGTPPENDVALGDGQVDMPTVLALARKVGIKHYYIEDESNQEGTQVPRSVDYLKNLRK